MDDMYYLPSTRYVLSRFGLEGWVLGELDTSRGTTHRELGNGAILSVGLWDMIYFFLSRQNIQIAPFPKEIENEQEKS